MPITNTASGIKAGTIDHFPASTAPAGWLKANGATISRTTYAALFAVIGTAYGAGDGATTFAIPDLRGEFIRCWDDGRGIDSARGIGTVQSDTLQGHRHGYIGYGSGGSAGGDYLGNGVPSGANNAAIGDPNTDGSNGAPRTSQETRPRNVAMLACIKY